LRPSLQTEPCSLRYPSARNIPASFAESVLQEILDLCAEACATRSRALPGSAEWHKCNGEILAYARLTGYVEGFQPAARENEHRPSAVRNP
jgi:hypothetical protein